MSDRNHYLYIHRWLNLTYVKTGVCEKCGQAKRTEWSNKSGEYLQDRGDWQELCKKCHLQYDKQEYMRGASYKAGALVPVLISLEAHEKLKILAKRVSEVILIDLSPAHALEVVLHGKYFTVAKKRVKSNG